MENSSMNRVLGLNECRFWSLRNENRGILSQKSLDKTCRITVKYGVVVLDICIFPTLSKEANNLNILMSLRLLFRAPKISVGEEG